MGNKLKYYIISYVLIALVFIFLSFYTINFIRNFHYNHLHEDSVRIAKYYSQNISKSSEAHEVVNELLEDKLLVAVRTTAMGDKAYSNELLKQYAENLEVDELYVFDQSGTIIYTNEKYIGWKAVPGHPVYEFMVSDLEVFVEEIRYDTETGIYYKYAYHKLDEGFIQAGILADKVHDFLGKFELQRIFEDIISIGVESEINFITTDYEIIGSTDYSLINTIVTDERVVETIAYATDDKPGIIINDDEYIVYLPLFINGIKTGTISVSSSLRDTNRAIYIFAGLGVTSLLLTFTLISFMLFLSYKRSQKLYNIINFDNVTGLPNVNKLKEFLDVEIKKDNKKAVLLLNCCNHERVNLTYGYEFGNQYIHEFIRIIKKNFSLDFFRYSEDIFVLYIEDYDIPADLKQLSMTILKLFFQPIDINGIMQYIDLGIGILEITKNYQDIDNILKNALIALDYMKKYNHLHYVFYNENMEELIKKEEQIETILRNAIDKNDKSFYLEFQPLIDIKSNKIVAFEALSRLYDEKLGYISPVEFIEVAEKKHIMVQLGDLILKKAIKFIKKLRDNNYNDIRVSINISTIQLLDEKFIKNFFQIIESEDVQGSDLEIEITETVILNNFESINEKLKILQSRGVSIALDDFGFGYSSFSRLQKLNIDILKLDKFFIEKISDINDKDFIIDDIISLAHKIGLKVVSEGVECQEQKVYLQKVGCDIIQGYYYSKPLKEEAAIQLLRSEKGNQEINEE